MAKENYLLLHQSGVLARTDSLKPALPLNGLAAIINLDTLEVCINGKWENIPSGFESLEAADALWEEEEEEEEEEEIEEEELLVLPRGSRRIFSPAYLWRYCKI